MTRTNLTITVATTLLAAAPSLGCRHASACPASLATQQLVQYSGQGALFSIAGKKLGDYHLEYRREPLSRTSYRQTVTVKIPKKQPITLRCTVSVDGERWRTECGQRKGGGYCLGEGLCLDYITDDQHNAYATTIIKDGPNQMRMFRTELRKGKAVRVYRERLRRN